MQNLTANNKYGLKLSKDLTSCQITKIEDQCIASIKKMTLHLWKNKHNQSEQFTETIMNSSFQKANTQHIQTFPPQMLNCLEDDWISIDNTCQQNSQSDTKSEKKEKAQKKNQLCLLVRKLQSKNKNQTPSILSCDHSRTGDKQSQGGRNDPNYMKPVGHLKPQTIENLKNKKQQTELQIQAFQKKKQTTLTQLLKQKKSLYQKAKDFKQKRIIDIQQNHIVKEKDMLNGYTFKPHIINKQKHKFKANFKDRIYQEEEKRKKNKCRIIAEMMSTCSFTPKINKQRHQKLKKHPKGQQMKNQIEFQLVQNLIP